MLPAASDIEVAFRLVCSSAHRKEGLSVEEREEAAALLAFMTVASSDPLGRAATRLREEVYSGPGAAAVDGLALRVAKGAEAYWRTFHRYADKLRTQPQRYACIELGGEASVTRVRLASARLYRAQRKGEGGEEKRTGRGSGRKEEAAALQDRYRRLVVLLASRPRANSTLSVVRDLVLHPRFNLFVGSSWRLPTADAVCETDCPFCFPAAGAARTIVSYP